MLSDKLCLTSKLFYLNLKKSKIVKIYVFINE